MMRPKATVSDSREQLNAEPKMLAELARRLGIALSGKSVATPNGSRVEIDGVSEAPLVLCEACAHYGPPKAGQTRKIVADAFKLLHVEKLKGAPARKIVLLADEQAAAPFRGQKWVAEAFRTMGVEVHVVPLSSKLRQRVRKAQRRQFR